VTELLARLKSTAPFRCLRSVKHAYERIRFERGLQDTGAEADLEEFGLEADGRRRYEASGWTFLRRAIRRRDIGPDDVFVDFGSGKGRVVWQAAHFPFARVVGVEISPQLNGIARNNIEAGKRRLKCRNVELVTADAAEFEVPDDMTYAYFYAPFDGEVFAKVIENIIASLDRRPRPVTLIYANPSMDEAIRATGRFQLVEVLKGLRPDVDKGSWVNVYSAA